jgi:glucokinase
MMRDVTLGIDIGGTNTKFGIVSVEGEILVFDSFSTEAYEGKPIEQYIKDLYIASKALLDSFGDIRLIGIGIGAPNGNYYRGTIEFAPNLPWKGKHYLAEMLEAYYHVPVCLTNDANAAAIGEMLYGAARGMRDFIVITLGTGVGSGIVANGQLIYGHDGFAGEVGHVIVEKGGRQCGCGRKGCLEAYASARGIKLTARELLEESNDPSEMRQFLGDTFSTRHIHAAAAKGDKIALDVFERTGKILGFEMANAIAYNSPEAIIFFGGVTKAGELLFQPIRKYMEEYVLKIYKDKVKIIPSALSDSDAAILGASALIVNELKAKEKLERVVL